MKHESSQQVMGSAGKSSRSIRYKCNLCARFYCGVTGRLIRRGSGQLCTRLSTKRICQPHSVMNTEHLYFAQRDTAPACFGPFMNIRLNIFIWFQRSGRRRLRVPGRCRRFRLSSGPDVRHKSGYPGVLRAGVSVLPGPR